MEFTWHAKKRQANRRKHSLDFADAASVFAGPTVTYEDTRDRYGEQRFNTTGLLGTAVVVITHTETDDTIHIISMRKAENDEIKNFFSYL
ncbi:BrnT family toxin [uncultured Lamprocystis sp.]|jgi:uncharacterized DUF497 family protein|uniref:BrnT family toxin n=1 Tax=uncultured Lamprocystis sp. TaxID=543132 RepID=UPI0025E3E51E|nr:BrnT family toxin [uncultured Lamprocystis sp.]